MNLMEYWGAVQIQLICICIVNANSAAGDLYLCFLSSTLKCDYKDIRDIESG